jgi:acyl-CoA synthetase (AMP-forming)/AMP-acid ligase II
VRPALLSALAARSPGEQVLHTGAAWLTAADLLRDDDRPASPAPGHALAVMGGPPAAAVRGLALAMRTGRTPVVVAPGVDPAAVDALLRAAPASEDGAPWLVLPTSGTTAAPRAVLRTTASWDAALEPFTAVTGVTGDDLVWAPGSASSTLTLWAVWHALSTGVPVVAPGAWLGLRGGPPPELLDRVTVLQCVPAVLADVLVARSAGALPALRTAVVAGAAVPAALRARACAEGLHLVEYYGAAELSFVAVDTDGAGLRPFPGCAVRVRDGEIEVRSPYLSRGYLGLGTDGPWRTTTDGWAGVGDRGRLTPDGVLEVAGRGDDALSVGGTVVLVADVERVLGAVNGVLEAVCWGEPDQRLGHRAYAAVATDLPAAGHGDLVRRLRAVARAQLPPAARPVRYAVTAALPRTAAGKPDRGRAPGLLPTGLPS